MWGRQLHAPRDRCPGPSWSRDPAAGLRRGVSAGPRLCFPGPPNGGTGCAPSLHSDQTARSCAYKFTPAGAHTGRRGPGLEAALDPAAGEAAQVRGREEEGAPLAAAPGLSLSSLLALAAALMRSIAPAVAVAAVAFATILAVNLVAGLDSQPWPGRPLGPQNCRWPPAGWPPLWGEKAALRRQAPLFPGFALLPQLRRRALAAR